MLEEHRRLPGEHIFTGQEHDVLEREASRVHERGDIVCAQLAHVDGLTMLEAYGGFAIAPQEKASIVKLRTHMLKSGERITPDLLRGYDYEVLDLYLDIYRRAFYPALPKLRNTDGEPLSMRKLIYDLDVSPQAALGEGAQFRVTQAVSAEKAFSRVLSRPWNRPPGRRMCSVRPPPGRSGI